MAEATRAAIIAFLPRLRRFCQALTGHPDDGDDLMQATVERALSRIHLFDPASRIDSWMYRIAQNLHIDTIRATRRRGIAVPIDELLPLAGEDGRTLTENRSALAAAQRTLLTVPDDQRAAFALVVIEGLSYREAADALDVPIGTIMSRLARARARIETALAVPAEGMA